MINQKVYGIFERLLGTNDNLEIAIDTISERDLNDLRISLTLLVTDKIETDIIDKKIKIMFTKYNKSCYMYIPDLLTNIILWCMVKQTGQDITPKHVFFPKKGITKKDIAGYINKFVIIPNRQKIQSSKLNSIIYDNHKLFHFVDKFAYYFNNSINFEDFIELSEKCPEFDQLLHKDYSGYAVEDMNSEAMKDCNRIIELILDSRRYMGRDHCLADPLRAKVGIKPKQFREMVSNIGIKPNGEGGIFSHSIDSSYMIGGLSRFEWMIGEAGIGRQAQILSKKNTADSGAFARVLGLNQLDTKLYTDPITHKFDDTYDCNTRNFQEVLITEKNIEMYSDRYYRLQPDGIEYNMGCESTLNRSLIGQKIYLRSPMTCASAATGHGICHKCYGELYYINNTVNIGIIAAEQVSQILTQLMLSAKHLLEAKISKLVWNLPEVFDSIFLYDDDTISINKSFVCGPNTCIIIDKEDVNTDTFVSISDDESSDDDDGLLENLDIIREYISCISIVFGDTGERLELAGNNSESLYFTNQFSNYINNMNIDDNNSIISIPICDIPEDLSLFTVNIYNDDLSKNLKDIMNIINLKSQTCSYTRNEILEEMINRMISCGMQDVRSVHAEIILMNQIKNIDNVLENPDWRIPDAKYQILTLKQALENNPSVLVSMQYENLSKVLYNPISFKKKSPSNLDMFYHVNPQRFMNDSIVEDKIPVNPFVYKNPYQNSEQQNDTKKTANSLQSPFIYKEPKEEP